MQREPGNEAISFIHLILQFVFYSLKKPMISDRKKKLETAPIKSDSVYNTQKREKNGDVFPYKWITSSEELFSIVLLNTLVECVPPH